jgi:hypothetical protein
MATLTEIVTAMVVHSSAAAYSHFGVAVEVKQPERPVPITRTVARVTPARASVKPATTIKAEDCPETAARIVKA